MEIVNEILNSLNNWLYTYVLIILLVVGGVIFTIKTKGVQFALFGVAVKTLMKNSGKEDKNSVTSFQALMISTASRVGTGNIAGVAAAIAIGGVGAVFWMWLLAVLGCATAFIESTLAQIYKVKDGDGFRGGPAYYIQTALKNRPLGILFAILLILTFAYGFNGLQAYNASSSLAYYIKDYNTTDIPMLIGFLFAILLAYSVFGQANRIGKISAIVVPIMASIYVGMALIVVLLNISELPSAISLIFKSALYAPGMEDGFNLEAFFGGIVGSAMMLGIKRGLFSNEAGMGSAPNAAAAAHVSHPVKQGLAQFISVVIDTLIICSATAFLIMLSGATISADVAGMPLVQNSLQNVFGEWGVHLITVSIFLFAFTSMIGNYYYTESGLKFITLNKNVMFIFRLSCVAMVFAGAQMQFGTAWNLADVFMGLMALVNLFAIFILGKYAIKALEDYKKQLKEGKDPVFKASDIGLHDTEVWK